jgi:proteic killer suppression protein
MRFLPAARCHELKGDRRGQLAVDLTHPHRLLFTPVDAKEREDGGLDWTSVTAVVIEEIVDYH